jgi:hypothetical protein
MAKQNTYIQMFEAANPLRRHDERFMNICVTARKYCDDAAFASYVKTVFQIHFLP